MNAKEALEATCERRRETPAIVELRIEAAIRSGFTYTDVYVNDYSDEYRRSIKRTLERKGYSVEFIAHNEMRICWKEPKEES